MFSYKSPENSLNYGYKPEKQIILMRYLANFFIKLFRLNTNFRFITELQQMIKPTISVDIPDGNKLSFVTGHGRLVWRAKTFIFEEPELIEWIDTFSKNDVFFDVGANVGCYSLYCSKFKKVKTYSFEPEINNLQLLNENIFINNLSEKCIPIPLACHNKTEINPFHIREFTKGGAINSIGRDSLFLENKSIENYCQQTLCMTLDDVIDIFNIDIPTKIKIDVDTNELQVVLGLKKYIKHVKEIYIELYKNFNEHKEVIDFLNQNGFTDCVQFEAKAPLQYKGKVLNCLFKKVE